MTPKNRQTDKHLPRYVYKKHGAYYLVKRDMTGRKVWQRLGATEEEMHLALAKINGPADCGSSMEALFERYRAEVVPTKAPGTQVCNLKELANLNRAFGRMSPKSVKTIDVYGYLDARGKTAKTRANREVALLGHVFKYAIRWGVREDNPCLRVEKHSEKGRDRYVEDWEYRAVYDMAPPLVRAAMEISTITGMRQGDVLALQLGDLKPEGVLITQNKTGKKQLFEWTPALRKAVDMARGVDRMASSFWLFATTKGKPMTTSGFQTAWQRLMNRAIESGVVETRFTFHDLRAKAASDYTGNATELMGHSSPTTTKRHYLRKPTKIRPDR